jgi:hypothetical protein
MFQHFTITFIIKRRGRGAKRLKPVHRKPSLALYDILPPCLAKIIPRGTGVANEMCGAFFMIMMMIRLGDAKNKIVDPGLAYKDHVDIILADVT